MQEQAVDSLIALEIPTFYGLLKRAYQEAQN